MTGEFGGGIFVVFFFPRKGLFVEVMAARKM